jgi:hypothetical protein
MVIFDHFLRAIGSKLNEFPAKTKFSKNANGALYFSQKPDNLICQREHGASRLTADLRRTISQAQIVITISQTISENKSHV